MLGVRLPILRKMAKTISDLDYEIFFKENDCEFFELKMLEGMVIGYIKLDFEKRLKYIEKFISKIDSWSVCDSFCASIKILAKDREKTKKFLEKYINSNKEFELRFCFVILLMNYIEDDIDYVLEKIKKFDNEAYYAKMAAAWCLSIAIIKHYKKTIDFIKRNKIQNFTLKKGITKAVESYRLTKEQKDELKKLRQALL